MKERIRNNVYMTVCGLLLYLGSMCDCACDCECCMGI